MGQSMTLRRTKLANGIENHNLYFSQRYWRDGRNSWKIGLYSIYHADEYSYSNAHYPNTINENAFVFPQKNGGDQASTSFSFSIWNERLIGIANNDNYFDITSICTDGQKWR